MGTGYSNGTNTTKYIKIKSGKSGVKHAADYISDEKKIVNPIMEYMANDLKIVNPENLQHLLSGINCRAESAAEEFKITEQKYHIHKSEKLKDGQKANEAYHVVLSYKGTDIDPEEIHEMGQEFARRVCGKEYQALVATHLNTGNYHNHVLINAYSMDGTHKFRDSFHLYKNLREVANDISVEHGLPILINGKDPSKSPAEEKKLKQIVRSSVQKSNYAPPEISAYDEYGRRRGIIEMILEFVRMVLQEALIEGRIEAGDSMFSIAEIKKIDEMAEYCKANEITDIEDLDDQLRTFHQTYGPNKSEIRMLETYIENAEKAGDEAYKLSPAELCPMQPKTKSDLFKALHDSEYMLTKKFTDIGEEEGRNIIKAIRSGQKENLPDGCVIEKGKKRMVNCSEKMMENTTPEEFLKDLEMKKDWLSKIKEESEPIKNRISEFYKVKISYEKYEKIINTPQKSRPSLKNRTV